MAISPPSDILLDVASAADPAKVREATARLAALAADPGAQNVGFSEALNQASTQAATRSSFTQSSSLPSSSLQSSSLQSSLGASPFAASTATVQPHDVSTAKPSAYRKFEAQVLQTFIEAMLPKDDEVFGDKESSGVYRSLMAEQLANQMAGAGGIGLAKAIEAVHPAQTSGHGEKNQG